MASLDTVSIGILLGALLVLAGILSSLHRDAVRGAAAAGVPDPGHASRRVGPGRDPVRRRPHHLSGGLGRARPHLVRWRFAHPLCELPQRVCARAGARHHRGPADRGTDGAGHQIRAGSRLERGGAGWRGRGLDRRGGRVLPHPCPRLAPAPARGRILEVESGSTIRLRSSSPSCWSNSC